MTEENRKGISELINEEKQRHMRACIDLREFIIDEYRNGNITAEEFSTLCSQYESLYK